MSDSEEDFIEEEEDFDFDEDFSEEEVKPAKGRGGSKKAAEKPEKEKTAKVKETKAKKTSPKQKKPPSEKEKGTKAAPKKASKGKAKKDSDDEGSEGERETSPEGNGPKQSKTIEETYKKVTQLQHILLRPDTYIGSVQRQDVETWVWDDEQGMVFKKISYVPGLYKIFDEILVNAADNFQRDKTMDTIKVVINKEENEISVWNNGTGIPIEIHKTEKIYVPELIFGHLLTSSNYDDTEKKVTGGRNGYGAKLANIFSTQFIVETADGSQKYKQIFTNNMNEKGEPKITSSKSQFTHITFKPDLTKFGMVELDDDIISLLKKRVYDIAGCAGKIKVYLNEEKLPLSNFKKYIELYVKNENNPILYEKVNERWEIGVAVSDGEFKQVSFVNSICTSKGGTHVVHASEKVVEEIMKVVAKKNKGGQDVKPAHIRNHMWIFVNCLIENPAFDSQTKETLNSKKSTFGSKCDVTEDFLKKVVKCGIVESVLAWTKFKEDAALKKKGGHKKGRLNGISKLDDANKAGSKESADCTIILTEGDSAKTLAVSGLSVVGRDYYGVFPLKGKPLNVREATFKQVTSNDEINNIIKIIGLQHGKTYSEENISTLRYGHMMIMTDQDHDGSHIKGLLINFIHFFWPSLLQVPGFLVEFITPIVKVKKGKQKISFYTIPEYRQWREETQGQKGWEIRYYKGLGTSRPEEGREYFAALDDHQIDFFYGSEEDSKVIDLAFNKKRADDRKQWMLDFTPGTYLDQSTDNVSYSDFINKELILFSFADCERSIPCVLDGFKPGQRKVIYSAFLKNLKKEIKVAEFAGFVSEKSAYHHGEASLQGTIINLAQNFVGSNNVNLLYPSGSFGSRLHGGKDAASARYIFTRLSEIARYIFPSDDDPLLTYIDDDGKLVEPKFYAPILPMVLVNGAEGIGTGWSTSVPCYNPREIVANIKRLLEGEAQVPIHPWYKGFKGTIAYDPTKKNYKIQGIYNHIDDLNFEITELPIGKWTQDLKEDIEAMVASDVVKDYKEYHTDTTVHFAITLSNPMEEAVLIKKFKLATTMAVSNLTLYDCEGRIRKFESPEEITDYFYTIRLQFYAKRKEFMVDKLTEDWKKLDNKVRFILAVINKEIVVNNRKKAELLKQLETMGFDSFPPKSTLKKAKTGDGKEVLEEDNTQEEEEEVNENEESAESSDVVKASKNYDYLLSMSLWSLTKEKVEQLKREKGEKEIALKKMIDTTLKELWVTDLDDFLAALDKLEAEEAELEKEGYNVKGKGKKKSRKASQKSKKRAKDSDDEDDEFDFAPKKKVPKKPEPAIKKPEPAKKPEPTKTESTKTTASSSSANANGNTKLESFFKKITPPAPTSSSSSSSKPINVDSDDDSLTLAQRLELKGKSSPLTSKVPPKNDEEKAPAKARAPRAAATKRKIIVDSEDDDEALLLDEDTDDEFKEIAQKIAAKKTKKDGNEDKEEKPKKAPAKKAAKKTNDEDEDVVEQSESESKLKAEKKPRATKAAAKKKVVDLSENEDDELSFDKIETKPLKKAAPKKPAPKKAKGSGDDEDDDDDLKIIEPEEDKNKTPRKEKAPPKPRAKKAAKNEDSEVEEIEKKPTKKPASKQTKKKKALSDSEDDELFDIADSEEDTKKPKSKPKPKTNGNGNGNSNDTNEISPSSRPTRNARKKQPVKYFDSEDDEDEDFNDE